MASSSSSLRGLHLTLFCSVLVVALVISAEAGVDEDVSWMPMKAGCRGSIAECMGSSGELDMDSEINRRILQTTNYISYGALQRNTIPCSRRGASYYNCQPGAEANPYTRGCSTITRCRS